MTEEESENKNKFLREKSLQLLLAKDLLTKIPKANVN